MNTNGIKKWLLGILCLVLVVVAAWGIQFLVQHHWLAERYNRDAVLNDASLGRRIIEVQRTYPGDQAEHSYTTCYEYDGEGRLIRKHPKSTANNDGDVVFTYDSDGRILQIDYYPTFRTIYSYDDAHRLIHEESASTENAGVVFATDYSYEDGRIVYAQYAEGYRELNSDMDPGYSSESTYYYNNAEDLVAIETNNLSWCREAEKQGVEWADRKITSSYISYYDLDKTLSEHKYQRVSVNGLRREKTSETVMYLLDPFGTPITDILIWNDSAVVERDEYGFVTRVTYYSNGQPDCYDTIIYGD